MLSMSRPGERSLSSCLCGQDMVSGLMKNCFLTAAIFLWTAMASADDAVVRVNGDVITQTDVEAFISNLPREVAVTPLEDLWAPVIERMINDRLVVEEARRLGHQHSGVFLAEIARFEAELLRRIYSESLITLSVADPVVRQAYASWVESLTAGGLPEEVHAGHILVETHDKARAIARRARAGEDFAGLARDHSIGPSAPGGGDLGWFGPGVMVPEFEAAAWALAPGEVSEPVLTQFGWHVIMLQDRRTPEVPSFAEMEQSLRERLVRQIITDDLERLRSSARIEILAASPPEGFGSTE